MTKYLIYIILGLPLSLYVITSSPQNAVVLDTIGLLLFSIGVGLFLKSVRLASVLTLFGLGIIMHTFSAIWYNVIVVEVSFGLDSNLPLLLITLDLILLFLTCLSLHGALTNHSFQFKIDQFTMQTIATYVLLFTPTVLSSLAVGFGIMYLR
ncbi:MAG: hypothetical protein JKY53_13630 [Flavobacteriales bacterium]|nr:hypothetical protein [Flavobacteriales bacterium]